MTFENILINFPNIHIKKNKIQAEWVDCEDGVGGYIGVEENESKGDNE